MIITRTVPPACYACEGSRRIVVIHDASCLWTGFSHLPCPVCHDTGAEDPVEATERAPDDICPMGAL